MWYLKKKIQRYKIKSKRQIEKYIGERNTPKSRTM